MAADCGRWRVGFAVIDARRNLSGVSGRWYRIVMLLYRFFIDTSRSVDNHCHDDGIAPHPPVWSAGAPPTRRRLVLAVRDRAVLPGYGLLSGSIFLRLLLLLVMLEFGHTMLASWLSGLLS